jgi:hypothetical protein
MSLATQDPQRTSLWWQGGGFLMLLTGIILHAAHVADTHVWWLINYGAITHLLGDAWFFFQLKARKAI